MGQRDVEVFLPRWEYAVWNSTLGWFEITAHFILAAVYIAIPLFMLRATYKRKDMPFRLQACMFAAFIMCCGISHALNAITFWVALQRYLVVWNVVTALISMRAFFKLLPILPKLLAMRSAQDWQAECDKRQRAEQELAAKVVALEKTEGELRHTNRDLQNTIKLKNELEARLREVQECHTTDDDGRTPTQVAIEKMQEATRIVSQSLPTVKMQAVPPV